MKKAILLTNFIAPYRVPLFESISKNYEEFRILVSTPMEGDRPWSAYHGKLDVVVQKSVQLTVARNVSKTEKMRSYVHLPYDTLFQLFAYNPDLIVSGELGLRSILSCVYRVFFRKTRLVVWATLSEHTEQNVGLVRTLVRKVIVTAADRLVTNGRSGERYLKSIGCKQDKIFIANQAIQADGFRPSLKRSFGQPIRSLLFVGKLEPYKGLERFLPVLSDWALANPKRRLKFTLVGIGRGDEFVSRWAASAPSNLEIVRVNAVSYQEMPELYHAHDALVLPSVFEEWGLVVNEAMAAGTLVIGSDRAQAVEELVVDGDNGITFDPRKPTSVARALERAMSLTGPELTGLVNRAKVTIERRTPKHMAFELLSAFRFTSR